MASSSVYSSSLINRDGRVMLLWAKFLKSIYAVYSKTEVGGCWHQRAISGIEHKTREMYLMNDPLLSRTSNSFAIVDENASLGTSAGHWQRLVVSDKLVKQNLSNCDFQDTEPRNKRKTHSLNGITVYFTQ
jgi:hypothetical protein